jgi:hypothetical protein
LSKGTGIIALPMGTAEIDNLPVNLLKTNLLGTVQGSEGPGLVRYLARFGTGHSLDGDVSGFDTAVPSAETNALAAVATELGLARLPALEAARRLSVFFQQNFSYTTDLKAPWNWIENYAPISQFLLRTRAGHCEYFATATALLLRYAGIPTRYVTGYSVQESSGLNNYIVRERHAHAWVIYYDRLKGSWNELDTTPSGWGPMEDARASWWEPIGDFFSRLWFEFSSSLAHGSFDDAAVHFRATGTAGRHPHLSPAHGQTPEACAISTRGRQSRGGSARSGFGVLFDRSQTRRSRSCP